MDKTDIKNLRASITVEASFCVPIFFIVMFSLLYEFNILFGINENYARLYEAADDFAVYGTRADTVTSVLNDENVILWSDSGGYKVCFMKYKKKNPFRTGAVMSQRFYHQMVVNGYNGKSMCFKEAEGDEEVYITETGSVYHTHSDCSYLNPSVRRVAVNGLADMRNQSGGKYKRCEQCFRNSEPAGEQVYITDYGDRYHRSSGCSGIKRKVKKVKITQIGGMSECNKCMERR